MTMGSSVQWYSVEEEPVDFLFFSTVEFNEENMEVTMGEWTWETGMNLDQITDSNVSAITASWFIPMVVPEKFQFGQRRLS